MISSSGLSDSRLINKALAIILRGLKSPIRVDKSRLFSNTMSLDSDTGEIINEFTFRIHIPDNDESFRHYTVSFRDGEVISESI